MSSMVQIRNVPAEFHRRLKARAAIEGMSMSDYVMRELGKALAKSRNGTVGVVLRPVAHALVGCEFAGTPSRSVWSMMRTGPVLQWRTIERNSFRRSRTQA